jgi:hypothetical protein
LKAARDQERHTKNVALPEGTIPGSIQGTNQGTVEAPEGRTPQKAVIFRIGGA